MQQQRTQFIAQQGFRPMDNLPILSEPSHPIYLALAEIQKPRSRFQLENFVVGQHDTAEQQYKQTLIEIQALIFTIKNVGLELKKSEIELFRLRQSNDEIDLVDAEIKELGIEQTRLVMVGAIRELEDLVEIWEGFPIKYTYEELEKNQPSYWDARLTRQAQLEALGKNQVEWSSIDALRQIGKYEMPIINVENKELEK